MNEKDLKIKKEICLALAIINTFEIVWSLVSEIASVKDWEEFAVVPIIGTVVSLIPTIILAVFAFKIKPEKFPVPLFINAFLSIFSGLTSFVFVLFSRFLPFGQTLTADEEFNVLAWISNVLISVFLGIIYIVCALAIKDQKKGSNGFTKTFIIVSSVFTVLYSVSYIINTVAAKGVFPTFFIIRILETVLLILVVKYVEGMPEEQKSGLVNYPETEEMTEGE
ncbi:MAG: hypothetical protein E7515_07185 [Ruminococcaceae bacterium]|jgi:FtsH-binding integral membrane protein|nr:hypothetical protein [Oscillospiraceae bacterium]